MTKRKRRLEPVIINERDEIRFQLSGQFWHRVTPAGPEFRCKHHDMHLVTWEDIKAILDRLAQHRDELWNLLCDGERVILAKPDAGYKENQPCRLVGVIWPAGDTLTFVS